MSKLNYGPRYNNYSITHVQYVKKGKTMASKKVTLQTSTPAAAPTNPLESIEAALAAQAAATPNPVPTTPTKEGLVKATVEVTANLPLFTTKPDGTMQFTAAVNERCAEFNAAKLFNTATIERIHPTAKGRFAEIHLMFMDGATRTRNNWVKVFIPNAGEPFSKPQEEKKDGQWVTKQTQKGQPIIVGGHKIDESVQVRYSDVEALALHIARLSRQAA